MARRLLRLLALLAPHEQVTPCLHDALRHKYGEAVGLRTVRRDLALLEKTFPAVRSRRKGQDRAWRSNGVATKPARELLDALDKSARAVR